MELLYKFHVQFLVKAFYKHPNQPRRNRAARRPVRPTHRKRPVRQKHPTPARPALGQIRQPPLRTL